MMFEEMRQELHEKGRAQGRAEGKLEGMADMVLILAQRSGNLPENLQSMIRSCKSEDTLKELLSEAAGCSLAEEFEQKALKILV